MFVSCHCLLLARYYYYFYYCCCYRRKDCTQVHSLTALREINREDIVPAEVPKDGVVKVGYDTSLKD